jgi:hypothetical protein
MNRCFVQYVAMHGLGQVPKAAWRCGCGGRLVVWQDYTNSAECTQAGSLRASRITDAQIVILHNMAPADKEAGEVGSLLPVSRIPLPVLMLMYQCNAHVGQLRPPGPAAADPGGRPRAMGQGEDLRG